MYHAEYNESSEEPKFSRKEKPIIYQGIPEEDEVLSQLSFDKVSIRWLNKNDFVTIFYGLKRTGLEDSSMIDHIIHPIMFAIKQIGILIPFLFLI